MIRILLVASFVLFAKEGAAQGRDMPEFYLSTKKKKLAVILEAAEFKAGDTIVDVGSGNGWFDIALAMHADSLTFYLAEIDSTHIKEGRFGEALSTYQRMLGKPLTSRFLNIVGTTQSTHLPDDFCDRILLIDTYHHLEDRDAMLSDMKRILKKNGRLLVYETIARKPGEVMKACQTQIYTQEFLIDSFNKNGFQLEKIYKTVNANRKKVRVFSFCH